MKKVVITGAGGLLGWHAAARVHAENCQAAFEGIEPPYDLSLIGRDIFANDSALAAVVADSDVVLHFAGVNRATGKMTEADIENSNPELAERLVAALDSTQSSAGVVYANSTHSRVDSSYGRGKKRAADIFNVSSKETGRCFVDLVLPHIFGEQGRPFYNNATGTLCHQVVNGASADINPDGKVELLHAGDAAQMAIDLGNRGESVQTDLSGTPLSIQALYDKILGFHDLYTNFIFPPSLSDPFDLALFNTYRQHLYPGSFPRAIKVHADHRGKLFEAAKGGGGGQSFVSWTEPGVTRGEHFHLNKVERFLVIEGEARISMRRVLTDETHDFEVNGDQPACVDIPTLWTHNITNTGSSPLVTLFWTNDIFDPSRPDTYADKVGNVV